MSWKDFPVSATVAVIVTAAFTAATLAAAGDSHRQPKLPINIEEAKAHAAEMFAKVDEGADGKITFEEFKAADLDRRRGRMHRRHMMMRSAMAHGDHAGDYAGDHASEFDDAASELQRNRRAEHRDALFAAADIDHDGTLSPDEFADLRNVRSSMAKRKAFDRLDTDDSQYLTIDEFPPHVHKIEALDANGDGEITRDELPGRRAWHQYDQHGAG